MYDLVERDGGSDEELVGRIRIEMMGDEVF